jgi:hypothetical protein
VFHVSLSWLVFLGTRKSRNEIFRIWIILLEILSCYSVIVELRIAAGISYVPALHRQIFTADHPIVIVSSTVVVAPFTAMTSAFDQYCWAL